MCYKGVRCLAYWEDRLEHSRARLAVVERDLTVLKKFDRMDRAERRAYRVEHAEEVARIAKMDRAARHAYRETNPEVIALTSNPAKIARDLASAKARRRELRKQVRQAERAIEKRKGEQEAGKPLASKRRRAADARHRRELRAQAHAVQA